MRSLLGASSLGALVAAVAASKANRIFTAEGIERHIQQQKRPAQGRRSRGPAAKPIRKHNRLTISKRVRRKHRRAA